jgi:predicted SprT family Zn-dependent metalloprotease
VNLPDRMNEWIRYWAHLWGIPGLASQVTVEFSPRMTRSLGRCYPERRLIRLTSRLAKGPRPIVKEALCHELAHIAVLEINGTRTPPHGPAWAELMRIAGFKPRTRLQNPCNTPPLRKKDLPQRYLYVHHCPVCQMERVARRPVRRWRCSACVEAGLDGKLEITRRP